MLGVGAKEYPYYFERVMKQAHSVFRFALETRNANEGVTALLPLRASYDTIDGMSADMRSVFASA